MGQEISTSISEIIVAFLAGLFSSFVYAWHTWHRSKPNLEFEVIGTTGDHPSFTRYGFPINRDRLALRLVNLPRNYPYILDISYRNYFSFTPSFLSVVREFMARPWFASDQFCSYRANLFRLTVRTRLKPAVDITE